MAISRNMRKVKQEEKETWDKLSPEERRRRKLELKNLHLILRIGGKTAVQRFTKKEKEQVSALINNNAVFTVTISLDGEGDICAESTILGACGYGESYADALFNLGAILDGVIADYKNTCKQYK